MINLAGRIDADAHIRRELVRCGIEIVEVPLGNTEVPYTLEGKLGDFSFSRAWYYWVVEGKMPFELAMQLYEHPVGVEDIRVAGHCGCPSPDSMWSSWFLPDGRQVLRAIDESEFKRLSELTPQFRAEYEKFDFSDDPASLGAERFVTSYHIDSELGLYIFAETIRQQVLVTT